MGQSSQCRSWEPRYSCLQRNIGLKCGKTIQPVTKDRKDHLTSRSPCLWFHIFCRRKFSWLPLWRNMLTCQWGNSVSPMDIPLLLTSSYSFPRIPRLYKYHSSGSSLKKKEPSPVRMQGKISFPISQGLHALSTKAQRAWKTIEKRSFASSGQFLMYYWHVRRLRKTTSENRSL